MSLLGLVSFLTPRKCSQGASRRRASRRRAAPSWWRRRRAEAGGGAGDAEAPVASRAFVQDPEHGMVPPCAYLCEMFEGDRGEDSSDGGEFNPYAWHGDHEIGMITGFYMSKVQGLTDRRGNREYLPISGNIYMYRAIAKFGECSAGRGAALFQASAGSYVWAGIILTMLIQIFAPLLLLFWAVYQIEAIDNHYWGLAAWRYEWYSDEFGVSYTGQRILSVLFLLLFTINGTYALQSDMEETEKMWCLVKVFDRVSKRFPYNPETGLGFKPPRECWLWVGSLVNSLLVITLSLCMFFVFVLAANEQGPKDIIFDAFGITFLYNLDDPDGELSFLEDFWDEDLMGDIYGELAEHGGQVLEEIKSERMYSCSANNIHQVALWIVNAFIFILPVAFLFFQGKAKDLEWN